MRELMNNNGKLMALMSGLFAGIMVVMGVVAILMGDLELSSLLADGSSAPGSSRPDPGSREPGGEEIPPEVTRITCLPDQKPVPHLCHQEPFNCCSETAASGPGGSAIEPRPIPAEQVDGFRFGSVKSKQKPLKRNGKGELTTLSLSGFTRKMSADTRTYFDSLFDDAT